MRAIAILINKDGKTIGATLCDNNRVYEVSTEQLKNNKNLVLENAIIDSNGHIRAKNGRLQKILKKDRINTIEHNEIRNAQKIINQNSMILYHGNKDKNMVPMYGKGENNNDYRKGFYTTPDKELAKEWAMSIYTKGETGYLHTYELSTTGLNILNLTELDCLHWIAELLYNRTLNLEGKEALKDTVDTFIKKYKLDTSNYDIIIGYRADDSYFTYAEDFISGFIYKETVERALRFGNLGVQVFIKSKKAFNSLKILNKPEIVPKIYKNNCDKRRKNAELEYKRARAERNYARKKEKISDFIKEN